MGKVYRAVLVLAGTFLPAGLILAGGEIYGTITTVEGKSFTGPIRWDRNENFWNDVLDARKEGTEGAEGAEAEGVSIYLFGKKILEVEEKGSGSRRSFSIPFGHMRELRPGRGSHVGITLKTGETIEVRESSTDLGRGNRGIEIHDAARGLQKLDWLDIERVEFAPGKGKGRDDLRLYGTVDTSAGSFTGFVAWDMDECLDADVLDGEDGEGEEREIPFGEITEIEKVDDASSRVRLAGGGSVVLSGTNDVDEDNRGIVIEVDGIGEVTVDWKRFARVRFSPPPPSPKYGAFDGGRRLSGKLTTPEGDVLGGEIVWDGDEEYSWEALDGEADGIEYEVTFEHIASIRRRDQRSAEVRLRNGKALVLSGTNDVNSTNGGILVHPPGAEPARYSWSEFETVEFTAP